MNLTNNNFWKTSLMEPDSHMKSIEYITNCVRVCLHKTNERQAGRTTNFPLLLTLRCLRYGLCMPGCSDLAYVYNSQSSCATVGQTAPFSATMKDFPKLLTTLVDSGATNHIFATCHASMPCAVTWYLTGKALAEQQFNVIHSSHISTIP